MTLIFITSDQKEIQINPLHFKISQFVFLDQDEFNEHLLDNNKNKHKFTIPIHSSILNQIITFCELYYQKPFTSPLTTKGVPITSSHDDILNDILSNEPKEYLDFISKDKETLAKIVNAADYLAIEPLVELCIVGIVAHLYNKTPEEVNKILNIK